MPPGSLNHEPDKNFLHPFFSIRKGVRTRGGTPLYKPCRYVPPQKVGVLGLFGLKTDFAQVGLESGMVSRETTGMYMYERIYRFNSK